MLAMARSVTQYMFLTGINVWLFVVKTDLFVVEIVDNYRFALFGAAVRKVVHTVRETLFGSIGGDLTLELLPVAGFAPVVDLFVQRHQLGVFFADIVHDCTLELAAQIQVFEPDEIGKLPNPLDYGLGVGDARKDRRDEADGADARIVDLPHGFETAFDADGAVHIGPEGLVECIDRPRHGHVRKLPQQIQVAQNQVGLCADHDFGIGSAKLLEQLSRTLELLLEWVVSVGDGADYDTLAIVPVRVADGFPVLDVEKRAPGFGVSGEALHERGVTILAGVGTPHIGIHGVAAHGE